MAELEALSNKELRQKCIEYGMPNVPVTDSSRKILIRRLEAAMSGKPVTTTPAKNTRRETIHVTKQAEVASSPKINDAVKKATTNRPSRRTIAVPERQVVTTTTVSEPEYSDVSPDRVETEPVRAKTKTPEKPAALYPKLPAKEPSPKPQQLSKTGVVTTSYIQETTAINKTYADADEVDVFQEEEIIKKTVNKPANFSHVPISEPRVTTSAPYVASLSSSTRYSSSGSGNYNQPRYTTTDVRRSFVQPAGGYSKPLDSLYKRPYEEEVDVEDDEGSEDEEDEVVLVEESPIKDAETPFLSQFARNLEHLKATPLRHSIGPTKISPPKATLRNRAYDRRTIATPLNVNARRSIKPTNESSFRQFIMAMEEKYHLKHSLILISIFILAVFIYVFFIQSV